MAAIHVVLMTVAGIGLTALVRSQTVLQSWSFPARTLLAKAVGDMDGDGVSEIAVVTSSTAYANDILDIYSARTGVLLRRTNIAPPYLAFWLVWKLGDADGDGRADLLFSTYTMTSIEIHIASGATGAILRTFPNVPQEFAADGLGDVNGDGKADFILGDQNGFVGGLQTGRAEVIDGFTGAVLRAHLGSYAGQTFGRGVRRAGDLDADGVQDYVVRALWGELWGYSGSSGQQLFHLPSSTQSFGEWIEPIGDFDADGDDDFAVGDRGGYPYVTYIRTVVFGGPSANVLWQHQTFYNNPGPLAFGVPCGYVGDMDGDGHDDLHVTGGAPGVNFSVVSGRDQSVILEPLANPGWPIPEGKIEGPGDANGDGVPDLLEVISFQGNPAPGPSLVRIRSGIAPGVTPFGAACPNSNGYAPVIGVGVGPRLGRTMTVNLSEANPSLTAAVLGVGFSDQQWNSTPLPIDLTAYGMPGCHWFVAADAILWLPTVGLNGTRHHATHAIPIPQIPQLLGLDLFWQWLVLEQGPFGPTGSVTHAMRTTVVQ